MDPRVDVICKRLFNGMVDDYELSILRSIFDDEEIDVDDIIPGLVCPRCHTKDVLRRSRAWIIMCPGDLGEKGCGAKPPPRKKFSEVKTDVIKKK